MPNVVNTQKKLEQLASDLDGSHATTATHLRELSAAVGGDVSAEDWAATNLQQVINPEALAEGIKARALPPVWLRRLEWLRNILIFAPLAFTWLAISQATDKYQALLTNNNTLTGQPFLLLWQQGFNHTLWGPFILSNLAFWDSFMLAAILILTGIVNWRYSINHAQAEQKADQLREDITLALGDATLCLTTAQRVSRLQLQQQPKDTEAVVKLLFDFIKEFKRTTDEFLKELAAERQQRGSLNDFQLVVERLSNDMISAANSMTRSNSELITLIKDLTGPIKTIPALVATVVQVEADLRAITSSLGQLVTDQANQWNTLQITLTTKLDELLRTQNQIGQELTQEQKRATQELQTITISIIWL